FPPLKTLDHRQSNLPIPPTPTIGRTAEIAALRQVLREDGPRLVTLSGAGGSGKTRLAIEAARGLVDDFEGLIFVSFEALTDSSFVMPMTAQALGVKVEAGTD